jgi:mercuric ion transport protein
MSDRGLLGVGLGGTVVTALCCFTPIVALGLGALGLVAWLAWVDYVLLPALVLFVALTGYAWIRRRRGAVAACGDIEPTVGPGRS